MPIPVSFMKTMSVDGQTFVTNNTTTLTNNSNGLIMFAVTLPPAKVGTLTTYTSNTAGTLTMADSAHGILTGSIIDIFWTDAAGLIRMRLSATVGTVAGTIVPFTSSLSATGLPIAGFAVTVQICAVRTYSIPSGNVISLSISADAPKVNLTFLDAAGVYVTDVQGYNLIIPILTPTSLTFIYVQGDANPPFTGGGATSVGSVRMTNGDSTKSVNIKCYATIA